MKNAACHMPHATCRVGYVIGCLIDVNPRIMSTKITRYMSFPSFIGFLNNGLFVPQAAKFSDKWEGLLPLSKIQEAHHQGYREQRDRLAPWTYISC